MLNKINTLLGNCKNVNCSCALPSPFLDSMSEHNVYLFDDSTPGVEQPFRLVSESDRYQFSITNNLDEPYTLVKVDNCLIISKTTRKCDALLYNSSTFFFIELKDVSVKGRKAARSEAIEQLEVTLKMFDGFNFEGRMVSAIIGFRTEQPYVVNTSKNTKRAIFKELYGVELQEGSQIILE